jgi:hypothetical protein
MSTKHKGGCSLADNRAPLVCVVDPLCDLAPIHGIKGEGGCLVYSWGVNERGGRLEIRPLLVVLHTLDPF